MPRHLGIRELRGDLAAVVRAAADGERVVVTIGSRPTAIIGPLGAPAAGSQTLDDLVGRGLLSHPRRRDRDSDTQAVPVWAGSRLDRVMREVRG